MRVLLFSAISVGYIFRFSTHLMGKRSTCAEKLIQVFQVKYPLLCDFKENLDVLPHISSPKVPSVISC